MAAAIQSMDDGNRERNVGTTEEGGANKSERDRSIAEYVHPC